MHGDGFIVTADGIEAHAHVDVSCSGPNMLGQVIRGADEFPLNFGFLWGGCMDPGAVEESVAGGALGRVKNALFATFVSQPAIDNDVQRKLDVQKPMLPLTSVRKRGKKDMLHNDALPLITVDAQTFDVRADGKLLRVDPATRVPLCRKYLLR